jgi:hypothetical protein
MTNQTMTTEEALRTAQSRLTEDITTSLELAQRLQQLGIRGFPARARSCPLAYYYRSALEELGVWDERRHVAVLAGHVSIRILASPRAFPVDAAMIVISSLESDFLAQFDGQKAFSFLYPSETRHEHPIS